MRKTLFAASMVLVITFLLGPSGVSAYTWFSGDNNCDQCHTDFNGFSGATHTLHTDSFDCNACHVSPGDNPSTSNCAVCHESNLLWNFHLQFAGDDLNGFNCATCHAVTPNDDNSWDSVKSWYRVAVVAP